MLTWHYSKHANLSVRQEDVDTQKTKTNKIERKYVIGHKDMVAVEVMMLPNRNIIIVVDILFGLWVVAVWIIFLLTSHLSQIVRFETQFSFFHLIKNADQYTDIISIHVQWLIVNNMQCNDVYKEYKDTIVSCNYSEPDLQYYFITQWFGQINFDF